MDCSANAYLIIIVYFGLAPILKLKAEDCPADEFMLLGLHPVMMMKTSVVQILGLSGLVVAVAILTHQPVMQSAISAPVSTLTQASAQANGTFVGKAHPTSGNARIVEENGQRYLELDESFRSDGGPDLVVLLHKDAVPKVYSSENYLNLGQIQRTVGAQRYAIPADVDLNAFQSAVIWCRQFDVTFGYATL